MAGARGLFGMQDKGWTDAAGLSMQALNVQNQAEAAKTKKIVQTTKVNKPKQSLGSVLGGLAGSMIGTAIDPLNTWGGGAVLGGIGSGIGMKAQGGFSSSDMAEAMGGGFRFGDYYSQNFSPDATFQKYGSTAMSMLSFL